MIVEKEVLFLYEVYLKSKKGCYKANNEDQIAMMKFKINHKIYMLGIICDGVGGMKKAKQASHFVVLKIKQMIKQIKVNDSRAIMIAIEKMLKHIHEMLKDKGKMQMGTTLTMILLDEQRYFIFHVGDSRIYGYRNKQIKQLSEDHCIYKNGRKLLIQAIGVNKEIEIQMMSGKLDENSGFILCSDGFYKHYNKDQLKQLMSTFDIASTCERMFERIKELDDMSVLIIKVNHG